MNRPVHFEILSEDPAGAAEFYRTVFGWEAARWDGEQDYWMLATGDPAQSGIDGGLMLRHFDQRVINTVLVVDLDMSMERVRAAGGSVVHGPHYISGLGRHAYCSDLEGTLFGIMQADEE